MRYPLHSYPVSLSSVVLLNGKYYCTGAAIDSADTTYSISGVKRAILDSFGNVLKDTIFERPGLRDYFAEYNNSLTPMPDGNGLIRGVAQDIDPVTDTLYALLIRYTGFSFAHRSPANTHRPAVSPKATADSGNFLHQYINT